MTSWVRQLQESGPLSRGRGNRGRAATKTRQHFSIIHDSTNYNLVNVLLFAIPLYYTVQSRPVPLCCANNKEGFRCKGSPSKVTFGQTVSLAVFSLQLIETPPSCRHD